MSRRVWLAACAALPALLLAGCGDDTGAYTFLVESVGGKDVAAVVTANSDVTRKGAVGNLNATPLPWQTTVVLTKDDLKNYYALVLIASGGNGQMRCTISKGSRVLSTAQGITADCQVPLH